MASRKGPRRVALFFFVGLLLLVALQHFWRPHRAQTKVLPVPDEGSDRGQVATRRAELRQPSASSFPQGPGLRRVLFQTGWGSGPAELGRRRDPESLWEGPMSLTVDGAGNLIVLDEVNRRWVRFSAKGAPLGAGAASQSAEEIAVNRQGSLATLDRLGERALRIYDSTGVERAPVALPSGVGDPAGLTGVFTDVEGNFYVEREHTTLVRLAAADGTLVSNTVVPGRPSRDGERYLSAAIVDRAAGQVVVRALDASATLLWQTPLGLEAPVLFIALLDSDAAGNVYLGVATGRESASPPYAIVDVEMGLYGLTSQGGLRATTRFPYASSEEESFREFAVGEEGTIYWMHKGRDGVIFESFRF